MEISVATYLTLTAKRGDTFFLIFYNCDTFLNILQFTLLFARGNFVVLFYSSCVEISVAKLYNCNTF